MIYSVRAQSIRNAMFNLAIGGKLFKSNSDVVVVRALQNVSFRLEEGDRLGLVGHNGSGKTSLLKVIAGIYEPTRGMVTADGTVTSMISMASGLDVEASGVENIKKLGMMRMLPSRLIKERIPSIVEFSGLGDFIHLPVKTYSAGMQARLMFAVATEFEADILVLDEWLSAGDASFIGKASDRMNSLVDKAKIVVLATHDTNLINRVCNKVLHLEGGNVKFFGTSEQYALHLQAA
jgi:lipopolysaccharide transport system ATP-binding protein